MSFLKAYFKVILIQLIFVTVFILGITAIRFFDTGSFEKIKSTYSSYALYDTDVSLVYDGE